MAELAGGAYTIALTGTPASALTVPLLPYHALAGARSDITPTSAGVRLPEQW